MENVAENYPNAFEDILITYKKEIRGGYGEPLRKEIITKRGFYSSLFDTFEVPPRYKHFNGNYLPDGFGGDKVNIKNVIKWEYCKD
jgi:hypothetical protein